jgi:hypothetical protein
MEIVPDSGEHQHSAVTSLPVKAPARDSSALKLTGDEEQIHRPDQHGNGLRECLNSPPAYRSRLPGPEQYLLLAALPTLAPQSRNSKRRCPGRLSGGGCIGRLRGGELAERCAQLEFNFPAGLESALKQARGALLGCVGPDEVLEEAGSLRTSAGPARVSALIAAFAAVTASAGKPAIRWAS